MKNPKWKKITLIAIAVTGLTGILIATYLFNMPHRNIQDSDANYSITAKALVLEYLENKDEANAKYLDEKGESSILQVEGIIHQISEDMNNNVVIILKEADQPAGVRCTFTPEFDPTTLKAKENQIVSIKGAIISGAGYDEDLELFEDVILDKCSIVNL
jgi:hypothetical protein